MMQGELNMQNDDMHTHKCGFTLVNSITDPLPMGCGHEWSHDGVIMQLLATEQEFKEGHMCPACGRGPWRWQVNASTQARFAIQEKARQALGEILEHSTEHKPYTGV